MPTSFTIVALLICVITSNNGEVIEGYNAVDGMLSRLRRAPTGSNKLIDNTACPEIRSLCPNLKSGADDLFVLECIQSLQSAQVDSLTSECHSVIWQHTTDIIDDKNVIKMTAKDCGEDVERLDCKSSGDSGQLLACILDNQDQMKNAACRSLIQRLEWVAFSDFRLIGRFVRDCSKDITILECGRVTVSRDKLSQGQTLACLQSHIEKLDQKCRKGVLHLSEMQSDNVKFDRQLFLACAADSSRLCADARPGSGAVYKCLMRNRNDPLIQPMCQEQLLRRYKLVSHDYKVSHGLAKSCKDDIKTYHCRRGVSDDKEVRLAQILLCLEGVQKNNSKITPECLVEMNDHRRLLMEDFHLSPEILTGCEDDIKKFCANLETSGKTIHCLMEHSRPKNKKEKRVQAQCQRALELLVKVSDVGEDWRVDPVLRKACSSVVNVACRDVEGGDARVMSCLMEKLGTHYMTQDCETALLQIQYFVARDFKLDPQLYRKCKDDAVKYCHAKRTWADLGDDGQQNPERGPLVLPCLHRHAYHPEPEMNLKRECLDEVRRVMRQRAISVDLIPEIEEPCLDDLSGMCFDKTEKGEEMQCLQDNLDKLTKRCLEAVTTYTEEEAEHVELNPIISLVCKSAMEKYCGTILATGQDEGNMMECLISHKNDPDLRADSKCRAAIEHFQIISLKNYHFTFKFKEACRHYVTKHCPSSNTKYDVVTCLSEVIRDDILKENRHSIPKECRQQVRAQLYQQRENVDFDPSLKESCADDIKKFCNNIPHGAGQVMECLHENGKLLSGDCKHAMFNVKKSELMDSATDYTLVNACKSMLKQYCFDKDMDALECLKQHKDSLSFDKKCHYVIVNRLILQNQDYRFNPKLQEACSKNIAAYCTDIVMKEKRNEELNGAVVNCLKTKFREGKLNLNCTNQMTLVLQEQALNYKMNPLLQNLCKNEIKVLCARSDEDEDHGEVEECLKNAFLNRQIITKECKVEVATLIQESKADIHVDPLLQRACTIDLLKYCSQVVSGDGRQLKCLQVILEDSSKTLEEECRTKLMQRIEMFKNAAPLMAAPENLSDLYSQMAVSPAKRYFLVMLLTFVGFVFIFGLFCGRVTRRTIAMKNK